MTVITSFLDALFDPVAMELLLAVSDEPVSSFILDAVIIACAGAKPIATTEASGAWGTAPVDLYFRPPSGGKLRRRGVCGTGEGKASYHSVAK